MNGFKASCRVKINAAGDWQILPPAGQITQIGDAGATAWGLVSNDDLFVSGGCEVADTLYVHGDTWLTGDLACKTGISHYGAHNEIAFYCKVSEEITVGIGQGTGAGVPSISDLCIENSIILGVVVRVTQAPGGGATIWSCGRFANTDEFITCIPVALGTTGNSATDGDGVNLGPVHNADDCKIIVKTNLAVTVSDMKVRITVFYIQLFPPED